MVIPRERRTTQQTARKATARLAKHGKPELAQWPISDGFALEARLTSLLTLRMINDIRRASRLADRPQDVQCGSRGTMR